MPAPKSRPRNISDEEWEALLAERKTPEKGKGTPKNIIRRPIKEPQMKRVKGDS